MTRTRILAAAGAASLALAPSACVSLKRTPEARFFVLDALVEPHAAAGAAPASPGLVGVAPVRLPGHLQRPQIVVHLSGGEVHIDEFARWAEPLDAGVTRVLAENLASLLPDDAVVRYPWRASLPLRCRVAVTLRAFSRQPDGRVLLEGRFALLPAGDERPLVQQTVSLQRGPLPAGPEGVEPHVLVAALNELLADLSREIAAAVAALPAEGGPAPAPDAAGEPR